jgi:hypothetical protein
MVCIYFIHIMFYSIYYRLNPTYKFNILHYAYTVDLKANITCLIQHTNHTCIVMVCIYFMRIMFYSIYYILKFNIQIQYSSLCRPVILKADITCEIQHTKSIYIVMELHIFHAHYVLWHILHAIVNTTSVILNVRLLHIFLALQA